MKIGNYFPNIFIIIDDALSLRSPRSPVSSYTVSLLFLYCFFTVSLLFLYCFYRYLQLPFILMLNNLEDVNQWNSKMIDVKGFIYTMR